MTTHMFYHLRWGILYCSAYEFLIDGMYRVDGVVVEVESLYTEILREQIRGRGPLAKGAEIDVPSARFSLPFPAP